MKYKIELTCWDYGEPKPYKDEVEQIFDNEKDAMIVLLQSMPCEGRMTKSEKKKEMKK